MEEVEMLNECFQFQIDLMMKKSNQGVVASLNSYFDFLNNFLV